MSTTQAVEAIRDICSDRQYFLTQKTALQEVLQLLETCTGFEFLAFLGDFGQENGARPLALSKQGQDAKFLEADKAYVTSKISSSQQGVTNWVVNNGECVRAGNVI